MQTNTHSLLKFSPNFEAVLKPMESMWESSAGRADRAGPGAGARDWVPAGHSVAVTGQVTSCLYHHLCKMGVDPPTGWGLCGTKGVSS